VNMSIARSVTNHHFQPRRKHRSNTDLKSNRLTAFSVLDLCFIRGNELL